MQNNVDYHKLNGEELPEKLQVIDSPPKQLFYRGENPNELLKMPSVAIVGSRRPTAYGQEVTRRISGALARHGITIISGLALGVDTIAHKACLENNGKTIAVLPCGPDKVYPATHRGVAEEILAKGGTLLTEYPVDTPAAKHNFIARNRLVSGMADIIIVTEAAEKSGTLHTANFALNQSKTVMAVPGPISNPMSQGTNNLLKSGALVLTHPDDVLFRLGITTDKAQVKATAQNAEEQSLIDLLEQGISDGHELFSQSGLSVPKFQETLTMLEINDQIKPLGNNYWSLR